MTLYMSCILYFAIKLPRIIHFVIYPNGIVNHMAACWTIYSNCYCHEVFNILHACGWKSLHVRTSNFKMTYSHCHMYRVRHAWFSIELKRQVTCQDSLVPSHYSILPGPFQHSGGSPCLHVSLMW